MPRAYDPQYPAWKREFDRQIDDQPMVLVGHSLGAGFLLRWLAENPRVSVATLSLVAPFLDPNRELDNGFCTFTLDDTLAHRVRQFHLFSSTDDDPSIATSTTSVLARYPDVVHHQYENMGHFTLNDLGTEAFPDLLTAIAGTTQT